MHKDKADSYLLAINTAIVTGYLFVFTMAPRTERVLKWLLLAAFVLYVLSLILFIWFLIRYPKRAKLFEELLDKTKNKFAHRMAKYIKEIVDPYARLRADEYLRQHADHIKSEEMPPEIRISEEATKFVVEGFVSHLTTESESDYKKAFKSPLDEKHARLKLFLDRTAFLIRRQVFVAAGVFLFFAILIKIITN